MPDTDLAIIVPTRGRPDNIARVIEAWTDTEAWQVARLVVAFDVDDPQADGYRALAALTDGPVDWVEFPIWLPMVYKLDETARGIAGDFFALGFAGDDHLPRTGGWASRYLAELRRLGTGIVYGDDGYQGAKLPTEWAMTSDIVRALGRMVPAPVEHMYCDNSVLDLGRVAGCIRHLPDVVIEHLNPYAGKGEMDAQYRRVNSRQQYAKDRADYQRWRRTRLHDDAETIRTMMPGYKIVAGQQPGGEIITQAATDRRRQRGSTIAPWPASNRTRKAQTVNKFKIPRRLFKIQSGSPPDIMAALADFAAQVPADRAIVELGVFRGATAIIMGWGAQQGHGAHVWGIDAWDLPGNTYDAPFTDPGSRNWARYNVKAQGLANQVTLIHDFSSVAADRWPVIGQGRQIGLLFVDADHSYGGARGDVASWTPHLADDAVIAFDDYGHPDWPGVKQAVDDMVAEGVLEPVQIFHDRLAVTKLVRGSHSTTDHQPTGAAPGEPSSMVSLTSEGGRHVEPLPEWQEGDQTEREHPGTGEPMTEMETPEQSAELVDQNLRLAGSVGLSPAEPAGKGEPVAAGKAETVPMTTEQIGTDLDPNVAVARETVLPSEVSGLATQTTVTELDGSQLRELAKVRGIALGRGRRTDDWLRAAIRAGKPPE